VHFRLNPNSGIPIYLQLMEQVKFAIETGALRAGEQLPGIRKVAEMLVMNPNTVAKAYRELEHEGWIVLHHGSGAFVSERLNGQGVNDRMEKARPLIGEAIERALALGLSGEEVRRLVEAELARAAQPRGSEEG
jgi:GntR family transcriptional regulator